MVRSRWSGFKKLSPLRCGTKSSRWGCFNRSWFCGTVLAGEVAGDAAVVTGAAVVRSRWSAVKQ